MGVIKVLKQFVTGKQIYPVTKSKAVYDDVAGRLDTLLQKYVGESDSLETTGELPRDADTLGGNTPNYFGKQADIDDLVSKRKWKSIGGKITTTSYEADFSQYEELYVYVFYANIGAMETQFPTYQKNNINHYLHFFAKDSSYMTGYVSFTDSKLTYFHQYGISSFSYMYIFGR